MDDFETRLQRELQRVAGEARGPAPRAAQARYRQARPSMLVVSKLAVGTATVAFALSASVVAAAAFSGSRPTDWGHAVKVVVDRCQIVEDNPGSQLGPCVSSFDAGTAASETRTPFWRELKIARPDGAAPDESATRA